MQFQTALNLYSNYLAKPQNIDLEWGTTTKFNIFKGWGIAYNTNLFYDDDRQVVKRDASQVLPTFAADNKTLLAPAGYYLGKGTTFIQGIFVTYDRTF